mgnify:CR=1 FL=1
MYVYDSSEHVTRWGSISALLLQIDKKKDGFFIEHPGVPESLWKPHKSKEHKILHRSCAPKIFSTPKKNIFSRSKKIIKRKKGITIFPNVFSTKREPVGLVRVWLKKHWETVNCIFWLYPQTSLCLIFLLRAPNDFKSFLKHQKYVEVIRKIVQTQKKCFKKFVIKNRNFYFLFLWTGMYAPTSRARAVKTEVFKKYFLDTLIQKNSFLNYHNLFYFPRIENLNIYSNILISIFNYNNHFISRTIN